MSADRSFLIVEDPTSAAASASTTTLKLAIVEPLVDFSNYDRWKHLVMVELFPYDLWDDQLEIPKEHSAVFSFLIKSMSPNLQRLLIEEHMLETRSSRLVWDYVGKMFGRRFKSSKISWISSSRIL